jgi:spermidine synthase
MNVFDLPRELSSLLFLLSLVPAALYARKSPEKIICETDTRYQRIGVVEDAAKKERYIYTNKVSELQGVVSLEDPEKLVFEYTRLAFVSLAFLARAPRSALFIGLGSGAMPKYLRKYYPAAEIDIVEIDPDMVNIAKRFFDFREDERTKVFIADGRDFIEGRPGRYDMIFLDAYKGGDIPSHLTTFEFLKGVKSHLKRGGVAVSNILSPRENKLFHPMAATYNKVFSRVHLFKGRESCNFIFVSAKCAVFKDADEIVSNAEKICSSGKFDIDLSRLILAHWYPSKYKANARILADGVSSVNVRLHTECKA